MKVRELLENLEGQKQKRAEFLVKTYEKNWKGLPGYKDLGKFIEKLAAVDPTKNGAYMQWMAKLSIKNPEENKPEDLDRTADDLKTFEANKSKIENKDVNAYKSFNELYMAVEKFYQPREKTKDELKADKDAEKLAKLKADIVTVYVGPEGWVRIPMSKEASNFLGQNTRWCTAANNNNMFDSYNKSDRLFVIYNKATKERFQIHIQSGQFMDVKDMSIKGGAKGLPDWCKKPIMDWYKENNPQLTHAQLLRLADFGDVDDLVKGSDHEDVFALMKKYNI